MERAALLPPLDEPPKAKPPTQAQLRKAGKEGRLRMTIETPDTATMDMRSKKTPGPAGGGDGPRADARAGWEEGEVVW